MKLTHVILCLAVPLSLAACGDDGGTPTDTATSATDTASPTDAADTTTTETDATTATGATDVAEDADTTPVSTCSAPASADLANASVPDGFCPIIWADGLSQPRGMRVASNGDVLVVERGRNQVTVLWDDDGDGVSGDGERAKLAGANGLNHGVFPRDGFLYASSASRVFAWTYTPGDRADLGGGTVVVKDIPTGGHSTRTVVVDDAGMLYVSVGSAGNVDANSDRSRVRRFDLANVPVGGYAFSDGEVFADGLRNEVGLAFDDQGRLWGVQNGIDQLNRADLGGDIHEDNPAEILSLLDTPGAHHGYPWCWTEYALPDEVGMGRGAMWAHPATMNDGTHDDAWCRDTANVDPPELAMQAHAAPLGLTFYDGAAFPADYDGDLFVAFHGSWNRDVPTGYKVVHVPFADGLPTGDVLPFLEYAGAGDIASAWPHRPVDVQVAADGRILVTSDASGVIIAVGHE